MRSGAYSPTNHINDVDGTFTVTPVALTVTADDQTKSQTSAIPTLTASYSGFVNGDDASSLTTAPTLSTTADATRHVAGSPYVITASGAVDPDYTISYVNGAGADDHGRNAHDHGRRPDESLTEMRSPR